MKGPTAVYTLVGTSRPSILRCRSSSSWCQVCVPENAHASGWMRSSRVFAMAPLEQVLSLSLLPQLPTESIKLDATRRGKARQRGQRRSVPKDCLVELLHNVDRYTYLLAHGSSRKRSSPCLGQFPPPSSLPRTLRLVQCGSGLSMLQWTST